MPEITLQRLLVQTLVYRCHTEFDAHLISAAFACKVPNSIGLLKRQHGNVQAFMAGTQLSDFTGFTFSLRNCRMCSRFQLSILQISVHLRFLVNDPMNKWDVSTIHYICSIYMNKYAKLISTIANIYYHLWINGVTRENSGYVSNDLSILQQPHKALKYQ